MSKPNNQPYKAFTASADRKINVLISPIKIHLPISPAETREEIPVQVFDTHAIWDTGATSSVITRNVAQALNLAPIRMAEVHGVHGAETVPVYMVGVSLPNETGFRAVPVTECKALNGPAEVLVGMDIIGMGDFAVSNYHDKTQFTFRLPSKENVCYVGRNPNDFKSRMAQFRKNSNKKKR